MLSASSMASAMKSIRWYLECCLGWGTQEYIASAVTAIVPLLVCMILVTCHPQRDDARQPLGWDEEERWIAWCEEQEAIGQDEEYYMDSVWRRYKEQREKAAGR